VTKILSVLQKEDDGGRHLGFGKTAITSPRMDVFR